VKGQSGNPAGRPPRPVRFDRIDDQPVLEAVLKQADRQIAVRDGDRRITMSMRSAFSRSLWSASLKGNAAAMRLLAETLNRAELLAAARHEYDKRVREAYIAECAEKDREAAAHRKPAPRHVPHPEDIIVEHGKPMGFRIVPSEEAYDTIDTLRRMRDILLMQHVLDERACDRSGRSDQAGGAFLFALVINHFLPQRMKIDDATMTRRFLRYEAMPQRRLLKTLYQDWRSVGGKPTRGRVFPGVSEVRSRPETAFEMIAAVRKAESEQERE